MTKSIPRPILISLTILLFAIFAIWWIFLMFGGEFSSYKLLIWTLAFQLIIFWGSILGFKISFDQGGLKNLLGKAIFFLSSGLLFQAIGNSTFTFYTIILKIEIPYPSLADVCFFGSIPIYIYGVYLLGKASGFVFSLREYGENKISIILPALLLIITESLFVIGYRNLEVTIPRVLLDLMYPIGQATYISMALILYLYSKKVLGGVLKNKVMLVLLALIFQYFADNNFLYEAIRGTWVNGSYGDFIYFSGYFLMALALINLGGLFDEKNKVVIKKTFLYAIAVGVLSWFIFAITYANQWFVSNVFWARVWMIPVLVSGLSILIFYVIWKQLEQSDKTRYEFVTIATHRFRTPLTRIKHGVDILLEDANLNIDKGLRDEQNIRNRELLERLRKDNLELIELTSLMLKSDRITKINPRDLTEVDLADVVFSIINTNRHNFDSKKIRLNFDMLHAPKIKADARRIKAVIEILVDNAVHYTYDNGEVGISITKNATDQSVMFTISNTGIPISNSDKKKIFESFYRTEEAKKMNTEGTGLGLFLAKNIVEMHGGKIWAENDLASSQTRFIFTLSV